MDYFLFIIISIVATITPGPAVFLAIKNGAFYGFKKSLIAIIGNLFAMLTISTISIIGLGSIILASSSLFFVIKILGGFYLIYLGIKAFKNKSLDTTNRSSKKDKRCLDLFMEAYFVGISNPKAIVFYTALFPQFLSLDKSLLPQFITLTGTFLFFSFLFLSLYALLASNIKIYLLKNSVIKWFNRVLGTLFIGFGTAIATSSR